MEIKIIGVWRMSMYAARLLIGLQVLVLLNLVSANSQLSDRPFYSPIPGDFCSTRSDPCCLLRKDDCSVPIYGTLCYCDEFCNRVVNPDCCPDYGRVCQGYIATPPPEIIIEDCVYKGTLFFKDQSIQDNCNTCTCRSGGEVSCTDFRCLVEPDVLQNFQSENRWGWTATNYSMFWGRKLDEGMLLKTGTKEPAYRANRNPVLLHYNPEVIPRDFDSRAKWPGLIGIPLDQGWCASSWAFSTSTVASDRLSIHLNDTGRISLSVQNLVDCDKKGQQGCQGGRLQRAWNYLRRYGAVDDACYPYTSGSSGKEEFCRVRRGSNLATLRCAGEQQFAHGRTALYKTEPAYRIRSKESDIMYEIMSDGPVQAVMKVHQDFFMYRSGIYSYSGLTGDKVEFHSVRIIGWGEEYLPRVGVSVKYWLVVNSWGPEWGENGLFRILRGMNESGIEEHILTVRPEFTPNRRRRRRRHGNPQQRRNNRRKRRHRGERDAIKAKETH